MAQKGEENCMASLSETHRKSCPRLHDRKFLRIFYCVTIFMVIVIINLLRLFMPRARIKGGRTSERKKRRELGEGEKGLCSSSRHSAFGIRKKIGRSRRVNQSVDEICASSKGPVGIFKGEPAEKFIKRRLVNVSCLPRNFASQRTRVSFFCPYLRTRVRLYSRQSSRD